MEFNLLKHKLSPSDSSTLNSTALLEWIIQEGSNIFASKDIIDNLTTIIENIKSTSRINIENSMLINNIFTIANVINITGNKQLESNITTPGCLYFDPINNELRLRNNNEWKTINFK